MARIRSAKDLWGVGFGLAIALGVLLRLPAVAVGFRGDDYVQRAMLRGAFAGPRAAWDLFRFAGPSAADNAPLLEAGYLPFWSADNLSLAMFRPLSSLLHALDHRVFGDSTGFHHLHSLAWWLLASIAVGLVLKDLLPRRAALVALLLFCLDESATVPVAWLANRSALVSLTFGAFALYFQGLAARGVRPRLALTLCAATLACGLFAGEYGLAMLGYIALRALLSPGALPRRNYLPLALLPVFYLGLRTMLDYGARGSGFYISPIGSPLGFVSAAAGRVGALGSMLWCGVPGSWLGVGHPLRPLTLRLAQEDLALFRALPSASLVLAVAGWTCIIVSLLVTVRKAQRGRGSEALLLASGSLLAMLPTAASLPEDRLLLAAAIGQCGLLGLMFDWACSRLATKGRVPVAFAMLIGLLVHGLNAPLQTLSRLDDMARRALLDRQHARAAELPISPATAREARVYVIAAPDFLTAANLPYVRVAQGFPLLPHYQRLHGAIAPMELTRTGPRSIELKVLVYNLGGTLSDTLYRDAEQPIQLGDHFQQAGMRVDVLAVRDGSAAHLRYTFDRELEAPNLYFMQAAGDHLQRFAPPKISESLRIHAAGYGAR